MNNKEISNLPSTFIKKISIFEKIKNNINLKKEMKKSNLIIDKLSKIKEYDVLSMQAFKQVANNKIKDNKNGVIIMSDINNLYEANKYSSKKVVNEDIKTMISKMKEQIVSKEINDFDMGKLGDEIYLYLPNVDVEKSEQLMSEFRDIQVNLLSLSCGMTSNLEAGIEKAMEEADSQMYEDKLQYKYNKLNEFCDGNIDKIIDYSIEKELSKSRIDLNELRNKSERMEFVNIYDRVVNNISLDKILSEKVEEKLEEDKFNENIKPEEKYMLEANRKFGNVSKELKEKYILAQCLSRGPTEGTISHEYFENFEKENLKGKKNMSFLSIDISGLKFVNDEYGHNEGDKEIEKVLQNFNDSIKKSGVKTYTDIVVKGAGNAFVVLEECKKEKGQKIIEDISNIESKLDVISTIKGKGEIEKNKELKDGISIFQELRNISEKDLDKKSFERKITDEKNIERLISGIYKSIFNNEIVSGAINNDIQNKDIIIDNIYNKFTEIVMENNPNKEKVDFKEIDDQEKKKNKLLINSKEELNSSIGYI